MRVLPKSPTTRGGSAQFAGDVFAELLYAGDEPSRMSAALVRFAPGARTAWHAHALGQVLYVTDGVGVVQSRGGDPIVIRPGDVVHTPPGEWHWHGATAGDFMCHVALKESPSAALDTPDVIWGEHLADDEYAAACIRAEA